MTFQPPRTRVSRCGTFARDWSLKLAAVLLLAALVGVTLADAQPPQPIEVADDSAHGGTNSLYQYLDGQGCWPDPDTTCWVRNTVECDVAAESQAGAVWNDQDDRQLAGGGYIEGTFVARMCLVADYDCCGSSAYPHGIYVNVSAPHDTLTVALSNDAGSSWNAGPSVADGNRRLWRICVPDPVADAANITHESMLGYWPEIPGTNGGRGQIVHYELRVTSASRTRNAFVRFEIATAYHNPPVNGERHSITNCP